MQFVLLLVSRRRSATQCISSAATYVYKGQEFPSVSARLAEFESQGHVTHVAEPGVHGSSMLDDERVGADTEETWRVVEAFLGGLRIPQ